MRGLLYLLPLCLVVSIVYEATHEEDTPNAISRVGGPQMSRIFRKGLKLFVMLSGGIVILAALMLTLGRLL